MADTNYSGVLTAGVVVVGAVILFKLYTTYAAQQVAAQPAVQSATPVTAVPAAPVTSPTAAPTTPAGGATAVATTI